MKKIEVENIREESQYRRASVQRWIGVFLFGLRTTQDGSEHRGPGALVPSPAGFCRTFPHVESAEDPSVCPLSAGSVSVQAASQGRGPDSPAAGLGAVPTHKEQRAGPDSPGESGVWCSFISCTNSKLIVMLTLIFCFLIFLFSRSGSYHSKYPFCVRYYMRLRNKVCYLSMNASLKSYIHTYMCYEEVMDLFRH